MAHRRPMRILLQEKRKRVGVTPEGVVEIHASETYF